MQQYPNNIYEEYALILDPTVKLPLGPKIKERLEQTPMFQGYADFSFWGLAELLKSDKRIAQDYIDGFYLKLNQLNTNKIEEIKGLIYLIDNCDISDLESKTEELDNTLKNILSS